MEVNEAILSAIDFLFLHIKEHLQGIISPEIMGSFSRMREGYVARAVVKAAWTRTIQYLAECDTPDDVVLQSHLALQISALPLADVALPAFNFVCRLFPLLPSLCVQGIMCAGDSPLCVQGIMCAGDSPLCVQGISQFGSTLSCSVASCIHRITQKHPMMRLWRMSDTTPIRMRTSPVCSFKGRKNAPMHMRSTGTTSAMQRRATASD